MKLFSCDEPTPSKTKGSESSQTRKSASSLMVDGAWELDSGNSINARGDGTRTGIRRASSRCLIGW